MPSSRAESEPPLDRKISQVDDCGADETVNSENGASPAVSLAGQSGEEKIDDVEGSQGRSRREARKNKQKRTSSSCERADNRSYTPPASSSRTKKGQERKRKPGLREGEGEKSGADTGGTRKTEKTAIKMKIKNMKMATRRSASRRVVVVETSGVNTDDAPGSPETNPPASPDPKSAVQKVDPTDKSIVTEDRSSANKRMKRKLSCSSDAGLAGGKPVVGSFSCQQSGRRKRSLGVLLETKPLTSSSSSAPASPASQVGPIRSRRSSPTIIPSLSTPTTTGVNTVARSSSDSPIDRSAASATTTSTSTSAVFVSGCSDGGGGQLTSAKADMSVLWKMKEDNDHKTKRHLVAPRCTDQMPANKKLKTDPADLLKDDCDGKNEETAGLSFVSAPAPISGTLREKSEQRDAGTWVRTIGTTTEPECLGPCEPGTSVTLEGIVWNETKGGVLVLNVTWRGKTYVGTLLDCTKYDWAPPQLCDSPSSNENDPFCSNGSGASGNGTPGKSKGNSNGNGRGRKGHAGKNAKLHQQQQQQQQANSKNGSVEQQMEQDHNPNNNKKQTSVISETILEPDSPILFQCPFGKCEKKFSAIVGLRYHQTYSHPKAVCDMDETVMKPKLGHSTADATVTDDNVQSKRLEKSTIKLSPDQKPNLDQMLKIVEGKPTGDQQQATGSPVYSDISEDDAAAAQQLLDNSSNSTTASQTSQQAAEKPMAIVGPQCASSSQTSTRPQVEHGPPVSQGDHSSGKLMKVPNEKRRADSVCPPLVPTLDTSESIGKPMVVSKVEPSSPRSTSGDIHFAVPPRPLPMAGPVPMRPPSAASQHQMDMMSQMNHPGFMLNPFNPANAAGLFQNGLGLEHSAAASSAHAGAAALAAAAAAGFPLGLHSPPTVSHHRSLGLLGAPPLVSMAPLFPGPSPTTQHIGHMHSGQSLTPNLLSTGGRNQHAHKIHELNEHVKRVSSGYQETPVIVEALRRNQFDKVSPSHTPNRTQQAPRITDTPNRPPTKLSSAPGTSAPTSVIASSIGFAGHSKDRPTGMDGDASKRQTQAGPSNTALGLSSMSPPVQRHVHTHHHTHTTFPGLLPPSMDSYAALVASQQAAAAAANIVSGYGPFGSTSKA